MILGNRQRPCFGRSFFCGQALALALLCFDLQSEQPRQVSELQALEVFVSELVELAVEGARGRVYRQVMSTIESGQRQQATCVAGIAGQEDEVDIIATAYAEFQ